MRDNKMRNVKPCPECGSDKKYKNCCWNKKPRSTTIDFKMDEPIAFNGISIDSNGKIALLKDKEEVQAQTITYGRHYVSESGKERKLCTFPVDDAKAIDINSEISNYDRVFAVDTNTLKKKAENHDIVSIGCVIEAIVKPIKSGHIEIFSVLLTSFLSTKKVEKPENEVWFETIKYLYKQIGEDIKNIKIALIVDSDLGNLSAYNNQDKPFFRDVFLPDNTKLIYASTDKKVDNIFNSLIIDADRASNKIFKHLEAGHDIKDF